MLSKLVSPSPKASNLMVNKNKQANKKSGTWSIRGWVQDILLSLLYFLHYEELSNHKEIDMTWKDIKLLFAYDMIICQGNLTTRIQMWVQ